jgi:uncharacterized membrane protein
MPLDKVPPPPPAAGGKKGVLTPVHFFLRGLAIVLPTILTVVIVIWILGILNTYIVYPATSAVKWVLAQTLDESIPVAGLDPLPGGPELEGCGRNYRVTAQTRELFRFEADRRRATSPATPIVDAEWLETQPGVYVPYRDRAVPYQHFLVVYREYHPDDLPRSATGLYMDYAATRYFGSLFHLSVVAVILIMALLYFLGRFVTARLGHWAISKFESGVLGRLPLIRNVYGSVKQVTDFLFSESQVEYRRVVALEYPRRGSWTLGLVTGDGLLGITAAIGEPCVTVLVPTSPMPMGGFTICVPRSHVLDLDLSVDQAMQFCISCGVLVPPQQRVTPELLREHLEKRLSEGFKTSGTSRKRSALEDSAPGGNGQGSGVQRTGESASGAPAKETP